MPYQIIGFRDSQDAKHFAYIDSVDDIFKDTRSVLKKIPKNEQYNVYYSVANVVKGTSRHKGEQHFLPFDIDDVDDQDFEDTLDTAITTLGLEWGDVYSLVSGNGVQFLIKLKNPISKEQYENGFFEEKRPYYLGLCKAIDDALEKSDLSGHCDPSVFKATTVLRIPETINRKKDRPEKKAYVINSDIEAMDFDITMHGKENERPLNPHRNQEAVDFKVYGKFPEPDKETILNKEKGCRFIRWAIENQQAVSEPQWYALLTLASKFTNGRELCHKWSKGYSGYDPQETDRKIDQATNVGPRTCNNINTLSDKCKNCPHFKTSLVTPLQIRGEGFIKTESTGFRSTIVNTKTGQITPGLPNYSDLIKKFNQTDGHFTTAEGQITYRYKKQKHHWNIWHKGEIEGYAESLIDPDPNKAQVSEFLAKVKRTHIRTQEEILNKSVGYINLQNGVIELKTGKVHNHSRDWCFMYQLPYEYNPSAKCPIFDRFMKDITCNKQELEDILLEFMAYSLSNDDLWLHKALILLGEGSNGKSTFIQILQQMAGKENYSAISLSDLKNDQKLALIENKLFNVKAEAGTALYDCEEFKEVTSGETMTVKRLYSQPYMIEPRTKFIVACNSLPKTYDTSDGFFRRLLLIPFDAYFSKETGNLDTGIKNKMVQERSGILNRVIDGYRRLHDQGHFTDSAIVNDAIKEYKLETIPELMFWDDQINMNGAGDVKNNDIYDEYKLFCERNGHKPKDSIRFFKIIYSKYKDLRLKKYRRNSERGFSGLELYRYSPSLQFKGPPKGLF